ncbi:hypothetical protein Tco_0144648 [Tanacetum coccineum]
MDFRSFILGGVDGELNFLPAGGASEGQNSLSTKSVNNNAPLIDVIPLSSGYPLNVVENASKKFKILGKRKVAFGVPGKALPPKVQKVTARASKVASGASTPLDVDNDSDIHSVLDNVLNNRTRELISALHKAKTSYDAIRARELDKDRAYAELERKCNEALQDLDKNPLEIDGLKEDRAAVVSKVLSDAAMKLIRSDDLGALIAKLVRSSIIYGRCQAFEEVAAMEKHFVLEKMSGYRPSSKEEYDQAGDALANASYPLLAEYDANPYASLEQLLSKKPPFL